MSGEGAAVALDADALRASWAERISSDERLDGGARELVVREDETFEAVVDAVVSRAEGAGSDEARHASVALAAGRAAFARDVDLPSLQRLFGHLQDVATVGLLHEVADADGTLCPKRAECAARRVRRAMERPVLEATRGWFDAAGRKLRHDVKTPLQATSLNLELLTLESAERGLDTEALDTIQRSLDQVVELLARAEPADG